MKSSELQELTASEPLTEKEEYEMQQLWMNDENSKSLDNFKLNWISQV